MAETGRVHSAWNHLEAFLELVFARIGLSPNQVRIQAILDGRDSPPRASLERRDGVGGYLDRLEDLLDGYSATGSLAWVVGRSTGMDRDYREGNARADYLLLTAGARRARRLVSTVFDELLPKRTASGHTDQDVPPIVRQRAGSGACGRSNRARHSSI